MWQYIVKRLLLLMVTLFGIAVVSFIIVSMAPGDPASLKVSMKGRGTGMSNAVLEKNRELFFLDRPMLLNLDPATRASVVAEELVDLRDPEPTTRNDAKNKLGGTIGTAGLPELLATVPEWCRDSAREAARRAAFLSALENATDDGLPAIIDLLSEAYPESRPLVLTPGGRDPTLKEQARAWLNQKDDLLSDAERPARLLLEVLAQVAPPARGGPELAAEASLSAASAAWTAWWEEHRARYTPEIAADAARAWLAAEREPSDEPPADETAEPAPDSDAALLAELLRVGQLAAPSLMASVETAPAGSLAEQRAAFALAKVVRKPWDLTTSPDEEVGYAQEWSGEVGKVKALVDPHWTRLERLSVELSRALGQDLPRPERTTLKTFDEKTAALLAADGAGREAAGTAVVEALAADIQLLREQTEAFQEAFAPHKASLASLDPAPPHSADEVKDELKTIRRRLGVFESRLDDVGSVQAFIEDQTASAKGDHRRSWRNWWYRAEEFYVDFSREEQMVRAVTQTRFGRWMTRLARLDFGESYKAKRPVGEMIIERLPATLTLNACSLFLCYLLALPLGIFSATHKDSILDRLSTIVLFILYSVPTFWAGSMMIAFLTGEPYLDWFPAHGFQDLQADSFTWWEQAMDIGWHIMLPVLCLTYVELAYVSRQMRVGMLDVLHQDYIRTARAKGLPERVVIYKHALRNALIPTLTLMGNLLPLMFAGSVIIETIFTIEGLGKMTFQAILDRDYPIIMANLVISGFLTLLGILFTDIAYAVVDPRIEYR
jgi:peptide/nickel transport system permease protein